MSLIYILLAILTIADLLGIAYVVARGDSLDEMEEDLYKYSVHLDERANKLALWEEELNKYSDIADEFNASYVVTESDDKKYKSEKTLLTAARKHLADTIAGDIVHRFPPLVETDGEGHAKRFSYSFTVRQSWQQGHPNSHTTSASAIAESPAK